ncbi:hypothetical protein RSOLAG22IIIB_13833 [Rhizoctonia solani]|uniref:DDE family endonuclease n=1 Tax=Rhizoctonia solani TaxID=456999 RepID=A0A0K6FRC6_9AGAM|nr:hypothetical protein RSOLAG22IIIB_13833 [Rhizoctonia solani]
MPKPKKVVLRRLQNISRRGARAVATQEPNTNTESNDPVTSPKPRLASDSDPVASTSAITLELHDAYSRRQSPDIPESPKDLLEGLDNLTLEPLPCNKIVLEDPPEDTEDPIYQQNPLSLADPEGDEALALPPTDSKEPSISEFSNRKPISQDKAKRMADSLNQIIQSSFHGHGRRRICTLGDVVLTRLQLMAGTLNLMVEMGLKFIGASLTAAVVFGRGKWAARQVRIWIRAFQMEGRLPTNVYGTWNGSVMEDEDLSAAILHWLREKGKYIQARDVIDFFGTEAAARFSCLIDKPPSLRTAQRWMHRMGYTWMKERRELNEGERVVVVWFHDESTFYAHDRRLTRWVHKSETAGIYKKGEGLSLMVADFVSADYGWLRSRLGAGSASATPIASAKGTVEAQVQSDAQVIFRAGKQRDGWFGTAHVVEQLSRAMSIIKQQYPNEDHVFVFDNATIHTKLPETSPNVNKMTLGPSKKVGGERISPSGEKIKVEYAPAILPNGTIQQLYHPLNHPIEEPQGAFKGMAQILKERGIPNAHKLKLVCPSECPPGSTNCCARRTMMNQPDILAQKSIIQIQAAAEGFSVIYLPKYHCELNPIEQCWGAAKRMYRDLPPSSLEADLRKNMLEALESVKLESIRRFAARSQRFVHAYGRGLSGSEAAWAAKKYRGHRIIPDGLLEAMDKSD